MSIHAYPLDALVGDYGRALAGLALVGLPLVTLDLGAWIAGFLGALGALFAVFAVRTALRQASHVELAADGIASSGPFGRSIAWRELDTVKLGYYATRRDGKNGWMQLALAGAGKRITLDSRITGFDAIVEQVARAANARGISVGATTAANLAALGLDVVPGAAE
jgi:hypothetical protein